jgi:hypothetical protein
MGSLRGNSVHKIHGFIVTRDCGSFIVPIIIDSCWILAMAENELWLCEI